MIEQSHFNRSADALRSLGAPAQRGIVVALAALMIVGGAVVWRMGSSAPVVATVPAKAAAARNPALDELVGTTKALDVSQQQVVDQLQVVQDMLAAQQAETRRTSERVAALSDKLEGLRQSFAAVQQPPAEEADSVAPVKKLERAGRSRSSAHRSGSSRKIARSKRSRTASKRG